MKNTHFLISLAQTDFNIERRFVRRWRVMPLVDTATRASELEWCKANVVRQAHEWLVDNSMQATSMGLTVHTSLCPAKHYSDTYRDEEVCTTIAWLHFNSTADCALYRLRYPQ